MKQLGWILVLLLALVLVLAVTVVRSQRRPPRDCTNQVLSLKGPHGEPLECVCQAGALASCVHPQP